MKLSHPEPDASTSTCSSFNIWLHFWIRLPCINVTRSARARVLRSWQYLEVYVSLTKGMLESQSLLVLPGLSNKKAPIPCISSHEGSPKPTPAKNQNMFSNILSFVPGAFSAHQTLLGSFSFQPFQPTGRPELPH